MAKVAMSHALNANIVHGWRKLAREPDAARATPSPANLPAKPFAGVPQFVPVSPTPAPSPSAPSPAPGDIHIELRRGATAMKITWPIAAAAECAAWMSELLG